MFDSIEELGIDNIEKHVYSLTRYLYTTLRDMKHSYIFVKGGSLY